MLTFRQRGSRSFTEFEQPIIMQYKATKLMEPNKNLIIIRHTLIILHDSQSQIICSRIEFTLLAEVLYESKFRYFMVLYCREGTSP